MGNKTILYCGECDKFSHEDIDGYGICLKANMKRRCSDKCRLVPKKNFANFDLCCNEQCPKRLSCQRYMTYKYSEWDYCYVMHGCIDFQLLKQTIQ